MGINREKELNYLTNFYNKNQSGLLIVYGQKGIGKTTLLKNFIRDKQSIYYLSREVSEREQLYHMSAELSTYGYDLSQFPDYRQVFYEISKNHLSKGGSEKARGKMVLVFDEFQNILKGGNSFMEALVELLQKAPNIFVILSSSSIGFVENSLVKKIGKAAYAISGFLKVRELNFREISQYYKVYSLEQLIETYSILGGITGYLQCFDKTRSTKENICEFILKDTAFLHVEGSRILSEELREPAVYYSILAALASGKSKLNDLYKHTGFSRAKISVYLKSLMELEIVEKVFSYDALGKENVQKGLYQISYPYVHFWFKFIYPNFSSLSTMSAEAFYDTFIAPKLKEYCSFYFAKICREYMDYLNEEKKLPFIYEKSGVWAGKDGMIDLLASDEGGKKLAMFAKYSKEKVTYEDYVQYIHRLSQAKVDVNECYLFSMWGFDERLLMEEKVKIHLHLKNLKEEPIRNQNR
ncbi:MAG: ATP-binding protein [Lachnospiraceae bacterium]|nr:ATP-binding protein [Lachnospiraceae bacterium]